MAKRQSDSAPLEPRVFRSPEDIDRAIAKLERRIEELAALDMRSAYSANSGADDVAISNVHETMREVFGTDSPEFHEHQKLELWAGDAFVNMSDEDIIQRMEAGRVKVTGILSGLIGRLKEKREDLSEPVNPAPASYFDRLKLHPRVLDVARKLFLDGHHWEAVFAASKALVNYIKERSGEYSLDGAPLARKVFSRNDPILAFNDLSDQTDMDEQEGMMHLFEGAILGIRNPGGHTFPEGPAERAIEYLSLLSLLAYRVQEAQNHRT